MLRSFKYSQDYLWLYISLMNTTRISFKFQNEVMVIFLNRYTAPFVDLRDGWVGRFRYFLIFFSQCIHIESIFSVIVVNKYFPITISKIPLLRSSYVHLYMPISIIVDGLQNNIVRTEFLPHSPHTIS